jgi:hypothetical protein
MPGEAFRRSGDVWLSCSTDLRAELAAIAVVIQNMKCGVILSPRRCSEAVIGNKTARDTNSIGELGALEEHNLGLIGSLVSLIVGSRVQRLQSDPIKLSRGQDKRDVVVEVSKEGLI